MILLGCLLAFGIAVAPRLFLILAWIFSTRWDLVWKDQWLVPLLGIIFLPFTTVMYMLVYSPTGIEGWDWMWIALGVLLDIMKWQQVLNNRQQVPGYPASDDAAIETSESAAPPPAAA